MKKSAKLIIMIGLLVVGVALGVSISMIFNKNNSGSGGPGGRIASGGAVSGSAMGQPPEKPDGDGGNGGPGGNGSGGGSDSAPTLSGANTADGTEKSTDGSSELSSSSEDENAVLATNGGSYTVTNAKVTKSGDTSSEDQSNFYGLNAVVAATENSSIDISNSTVTSDSEGSNGIFATGSDAKVRATNVTIKTTANSSRGLDATYEGTIVASNMDITTSGDHCAALATDRGGGSVSADASKLSTSGQGSPLIYSTGVIEVTNSTGESTGSQIVGMEGLNTVRIKACTFTGSANTSSESVSNGVFLYQSTSGDSSEGTAEFECSDSTLTSKISGGSMFYVTNTAANIVLSNTNLDFDSDNNALLTAGGNDSSRNWGTKGENGGDVTFTAINEQLKGNISCDGISNITCYFTTNTNYTGTIINDTTYTGDGGVTINMAAGTTWTVTKDCTVKELNVADGANIRDASGKTVTIKTSDGTVQVDGDSELTITTDSYSTTDKSSGAGTITDFTIDRN